MVSMMVSESIVFRTQYLVVEVGDTFIVLVVSPVDYKILVEAVYPMVGSISKMGTILE